MVRKTNEENQKHFRTSTPPPLSYLNNHSMRTQWVHASLKTWLKLIFTNITWVEPCLSVCFAYTTLISEHESQRCHDITRQSLRKDLHMLTKPTKFLVCCANTFYCEIEFFRHTEGLSAFMCRRCGGGYSGRRKSWCWLLIVYAQVSPARKVLYTDGRT